jgi:hypothetical protein
MRLKKSPQAQMLFLLTRACSMEAMSGLIEYGPNDRHRRAAATRRPIGASLRRINRHKVSIKFSVKSLKTKERDTSQPSHFFEGSST